MSKLYRFEQFVLDPRRRTLSRADSPIALTAKAFDVLLYLVQNPNRLVTKEELLKGVWGDTFVEEGNLTQYISHLRKALGDSADDARLIVTIARKGYQFALALEEVDAADLQETVQRRTEDAAFSRDIPPEITTAVTRRTRGWRATIVLASSVTVLVVGYASWQYFLNAGSPPPGEVRLAVLPFKNLTGDPNKEYLADGLTDELISHLGRLTQGQMGVISRTSVMGYKQKEISLDQIARDLSVRYVLESSLRENGGRLRLSTQLVQVKDQTHLWSKDYDYPAKDIFSVGDDVASAVAREVQLGSVSPQRFVAQHPASPEAFDAYLQGYYFFQKNTNTDSEMAAKYYERATQLDPSYALAWAGLSRVRNWQVNIGVLPAEEGHRLARQAGDRALALDPNLAEAHAQMARLARQLDFDWAKADAFTRRALALEPMNPEMLRSAGVSAEIFGRFDEALQLVSRAADMDPLNAESWMLLAEIQFYKGELDQAITNAKKALGSNPDVWPGSILLSQIYVLQGQPKIALQEIGQIRYGPLQSFLYPIAYHALGQQKESDAAVGELISKYPSYEYQIAQVYAFRNQPKEAFDWLERAYAHHNSGLMGTKVDPLLRGLHRDPRFATLLKKLNFPS